MSASSGGAAAAAVDASSGGDFEEDMGVSGISPGMMAKGFSYGVPGGGYIAVKWHLMRERVFQDSVTRLVESGHPSPMKAMEEPPSDMRMPLTTWQTVGIAREHALWDLVRAASPDVYGVYYSDFMNELKIPTSGGRKSFTVQMVDFVNKCRGDYFKALPPVTPSSIFPKTVRPNAKTHKSVVDKVVPLYLLPFARFATPPGTDIAFDMQMENVAAALARASTGQVNASLLRGVHAQFVANLSAARNISDIMTSKKLAVEAKQRKTLERTLKARNIALEKRIAENRASLRALEEKLEAQQKEIDDLKSRKRKSKSKTSGRVEKRARGAAAAKE